MSADSRPVKHCVQYAWHCLTYSRRLASLRLCQPTSDFTDLLLSPLPTYKPLPSLGWYVIHSSPNQASNQPGLGLFLLCRTTESYSETSNGSHNTCELKLLPLYIVGAYVRLNHTPSVSLLPECLHCTGHHYPCLGTHFSDLLDCSSVTLVVRPLLGLPSPSPTPQLEKL